MNYFTAITNFECLESLINSINMHGSEYCVDNTYCKQGEVCCSNNCTRIQLSKHHCWYRNIYQTVGETNTTTNDICTLCSCNTDDHIATMESLVLRYPNEGQNVSVYVLSTKNSAYLDTSSMYALEFEGNIMKVDSLKNTFRHGLCAYSTESVIVKSEPDKFGNYAETTFKVNIIDRFEPVFHECPHDRVIQSSDLFEWTAPTVTDNVGVQDIDGPVLPQRNKTNVVPGTYTVINKAIDWSNNTATCQFTITVKDPSGGSLVALVVIALVAFRVVKIYSINKKKEISSNQNVHIYGSVKDINKF
ncbi:unnamed protein product [Mytilus edulis]|uniref:HYR domain-containing protein n=1 Tax=Mytilus edulis TaxID=6550 RepID=A0A8S3RGQ3_MYTED|nr:unnamed protein product [Mytilus edulis]